MYDGLKHTQAKLYLQKNPIVVDKLSDTESPLT